ncbi:MULTISPECIES: hypothetical protein [Buttiauxella]|nr:MULTISPECIES: hypothetical protein [Buttiauxella]
MSVYTAKQQHFVVCYRRQLSPTQRAAVSQKAALRLFGNYFLP